MTTLLRVTDDTTTEEVREAITTLSAQAARTLRGPEHDRLHARIDALLDELVGR